VHSLQQTADKPPGCHDYPGTTHAEQQLAAVGQLHAGNSIREVLGDQLHEDDLQQTEN
jgi:hypothetical protein